MYKGWFYLVAGSLSITSGLVNPVTITYCGYYQLVNIGRSLSLSLAAKRQVVEGMYKGWFYLVAGSLSIKVDW